MAPLFSSGNHEFEDRVHVDGDEGVIHFRPLIKEDEGDYRCHAFNDAGDDSVTGHLRVLSNYHILFVAVSYQMIWEHKYIQMIYPSHAAAGLYMLMTFAVPSKLKLFLKLSAH